MSPEQARSRPADARSDLFALGAVLYEMLAGRRPFVGATAADTLSAILREDPPPSETGSGAVPQTLDRVVRRCLEKEPSERFQTARDVGFALEALTQATDTTSSGTAAWGASSEAPGRRRVTARSLLRAAALVALGAATAFTCRWLLASPPALRIVNYRPLTGGSLGRINSVATDGERVYFTIHELSGDSPGCAVRRCVGPVGASVRRRRGARRVEATLESPDVGQRVPLGGRLPSVVRTRTRGRRAQARPRGERRRLVSRRPEAGVHPRHLARPAGGGARRRLAAIDSVRGAGPGLPRLGAVVPRWHAPPFRHAGRRHGAAVDHGDPRSRRNAPPAPRGFRGRLVSRRESLPLRQRWRVGRMGGLPVPGPRAASTSLRPWSLRAFSPGPSGASSS